jgi:hypothetical protein
MFGGLSDSAAAALALTELSAASDERKPTPNKIVEKEPLQYERPSEHVNPYQIGGRPLVHYAPPHDKEASSPQHRYYRDPNDRRAMMYSGPTTPGYTNYPITSPTVSITPSSTDPKGLPSHKRKLSRK